jgi:hypothetical protein
MGNPDNGFGCSVFVFGLQALPNQEKTDCIMFVKFVEKVWIFAQKAFFVFFYLFLIYVITKLILLLY